MLQCLCEYLPLCGSPLGVFSVLLRGHAYQFVPGIAQSTDRRLVDIGYYAVQVGYCHAVLYLVKHQRLQAQLPLGCLMPGDIPGVDVHITALRNRCQCHGEHPGSNGSIDLELFPGVQRFLHSTEPFSGHRFAGLPAGFRQNLQGGGVGIHKNTPAANPEYRIGVLLGETRQIGYQRFRFFALCDVQRVNQEMVRTWNGGCSAGKSVIISAAVSEAILHLSNSRHPQFGEGLCHRILIVGMHEIKGSFVEQIFPGVAQKLICGFVYLLIPALAIKYPQHYWRVLVKRSVSFLTPSQLLV